MILGYDFETYIKDADNIYDLVSNCFGVLCENIQEHPKFISEYIDEGNGENCNPNIKVLNEFSELIMMEMVEYRETDYPQLKERILELIDNLELQEYQEEKENHLTVIYCILSAINSAVMSWDTKWMNREIGPLDRQRKTSYRVYLNMQRTLHADYVHGLGRERISQNTFFDQFDSFRFIDESNWISNVGTPRVKYISLSHNKYNQYNQYNNRSDLKIAVIPASCEMNFQFVSTRGSGLRVDYSACEQERLGERICKTMEAAIFEKCDIIVLPEYVVSQYIYEKVRQTIKNCRTSLKSEMETLLVFVGSSWTEEDNNVMRILDSWGDEVGKYYKYSSFVKRNEGKSGFKQYEALREPGKYCDVIAIEDMGIFLPAICRDVIDGAYTNGLVKALLPLIVVIAAWSNSVASFESHQNEFANKYFTSSVLANACSAVAKEKTVIGNGCIVHKENTVPGTQKVDIMRQDCVDTCQTHSCFYIIDYDFGYLDREKNTNICISCHKI